MLQKRQSANSRQFDYQKVIITRIIVGVLNLKMVQANCVESVDTQIKQLWPVVANNAVPKLEAEVPTV